MWIDHDTYVVQDHILDAEFRIKCDSIESVVSYSSYSRRRARYIDRILIRSLYTEGHFIFILGVFIYFIFASQNWVALLKPELPQGQEIQSLIRILESTVRGKNRKKEIKSKNFKEIMNFIKRTLVIPKLPLKEWL